MDKGQPEPQQPDIVALMDQLASTAKEVARVVAAYHNQILADGMPPEYAFALTLAYQTSLLAKG